MYKSCIKTTKDLLEKRFIQDNKEINDKTKKGQALTQKLNMAKNKDERHRNPETTSIYDLPKD